MTEKEFLEKFDDFHICRYCENFNPYISKNYSCEKSTLRMLSLAKHCEDFKLSVEFNEILEHLR